MNRILTVLALLCLMVCEQRVFAQSDVPGDLACEFETHFLPKGENAADAVSKWRMWRSQTEVEVWQIGSRDGEVWKLDGAGGVMFKRIFHPERTEVVFTAMDLKVIGHPVEWSRCFSLVSRAFIDEFLKSAGRETFMEESLECFEGEAKGAHWRLLWSDERQLAVEIRVKNEKGTTLTKLRECHPLAAQPWQRLSERGYQAMDFTDLGDNDTDPVVQRLMRRMGIKCSHGTCGSVCLIPR